MFFNRIEKHLKDLNIISNRIIADEIQELVLSDKEIQKIFYDLYKIPTVFEDIMGYNDLFSELKSPCESILREYYHSFYNFIQDTKNINNELISRFGSIDDLNKGSIFEYIYRKTGQKTLQNISNVFFEEYENYCEVNHYNPCKLKEFINSLYTPYLINLGLSDDPSPKLKGFVEYPILLILSGYESLFCIIKNNIKDISTLERLSVANNYKKIRENIHNIIKKNEGKSGAESDVIRQSLAKISYINENYKDFLSYN